MSKKVLVTGCAGFIGYNFSLQMLNEGYTILGIDNLNDAYSPILKKERKRKLEENNYFSFSDMDLSEVKNFESIKENFDAVIHLAARAGVRQSFLNPEMYVKDNTLATTNIASYVNKESISKLIIASTSSIYGDSGSNKVTENKDELDYRRSLFSKAFEVLNEREKEIIKLRKLSENPLKLEDLSKKYKISRERVRQIEEKALEKLQKEISNIR